MKDRIVSNLINLKLILQAFVGSMVTKLQLYVQQVNGALEETSQSVLSSLPRILRDTQLLQQEAIALQDKMVVVKQEIANVIIQLLLYNKFSKKLMFFRKLY